MSEEMFKSIQQIVSLSLKFGFIMSGCTALAGYALGKAFEALNIATK